MPRSARVKGKSGIYHVILRGANRQEIFHDDADFLRFLETLEKYKGIVKLKVYGWCLMGNHVHLLLGEGAEELAVSMKRIGVSFAWYYNWKYNTTGHLFQDRYKSENVESDQYLLTVIRYIHQNPVRAGMVGRMEDWKWSSCNAYYGKKSYPMGLLDSEMVLEIVSSDKDNAIIKFKEYSETGNDDNCLEDIIKKRLTDEEAVIEIKKLIPGCELAKVKSMPKAQRDELIAKVKGIEGLTQRQTARIMGISPNLVFKS